MLSTMVWDCVYQDVNERSAAKDVLDRMSWMGNKVAMGDGPVPMDFGEVMDE